MRSLLAVVPMIANWIWDGDASQVLSNFSLYHSMMMWMVHWCSASHDTPESTEQCTSSSDTRDNGIWFCVAKSYHEHQSYSNRNYNLKPAPVESPGNAVNDFPMKFRVINAENRVKKQ